MNDKLDKLFEMQKNFDEFVTLKRKLDFTQQQWIEKRTLALMDELGEFLHETNYKWWKAPKETNSANIKEELIDVLHFYLGLCIDVGLTSDELFEIYSRKNKENFDRQNGLSKKEGYSIK